MKTNKARWVARASMLSVFSIIGWASAAKIDQVTRAQATVIASGRTQTLQSPENGVVTQLHVKEGDFVKAGQLLATLQKDRAQAAVNDSSAKVAALRITLTRLRAEVFETPLNFETSLNKYPDYIGNQTQLFKKRKTAIDQDLSALTQLLQLAQSELGMNQGLEKTGDVAKSEIIRLERQVADIKAQIANKRNKYFQDAQTEMTKAQEDLASQVEQLRDRAQLLEHTELRAGLPGVVKNIKVNTKGGVVRSGETVMEILPTETDLVIEAKISPSDIAFIVQGQAASVKLDAYDYSIFGAMKGHVQYISADTVTEETRQGPQSFYRVLVRIDVQEFQAAGGDKIKIRPGMTASVDMKAMERTVLSYLTKPVTKTLSQSLGER